MGTEQLTSSLHAASVPLQDHLAKVLLNWDTGVGGHDAGALGAPLAAAKLWLGGLGGVHQNAVQHMLGIEGWCRPVHTSGMHRNRPLH